MNRKGCYVQLVEPDGKKRRWRLAFTHLKGYWARLDWNKRTVWFHETIDNKTLLGAIAHEVDHIRHGTGQGYDDGLEGQLEDKEAGLVAAAVKMGLIADD